MALADVYDALTSRRVYKEAYSHDRAKSMMTEEAGTHFDQAVVEAFLVHEQKFITIREQFAESDDKAAAKKEPTPPAPV